MSESPDPTAPVVRRGKLKVFLGYAAGVGKTYKMLEEAQLARRENRDGANVYVFDIRLQGDQETVFFDV